MKEERPDSGRREHHCGSTRYGWRPAACRLASALGTESLAMSRRAIACVIALFEQDQGIAKLGGLV